MIYRNSLRPLHSFVIGLASMFDGLVTVLTLGFYGSSLTFNVCAWATLREIEVRKQKKLAFQSGSKGG